MTIHTPINPAEVEARKLAADILAGYAQPYGKSGCYTAKEWTAAAQYLTDTDDCHDMIYMIEQEEACQEADGVYRLGDEADWRYDLMRDEQMLAALERGA